MSEKRKKTHGILLRPRGKRSLSLDIFDASQWDGGCAGAWRIRINDRWHGLDSQRVFLRWAEVGQLAAALMAGEDALGGATEESPPYLPYKAEVRVRSDDHPVHGQRGWVHAPPHREADGWRVWVWIWGGPVKVPADRVTLVRVR
jgi:hypothetical protein